MNNRKFYLLRLILLLSDFIILNFTYFIAYLLFVDEVSKETEYINLFALILFDTLWVVFSGVFKLYSYKTIVQIEKIYRNTLRTFLAQAVLSAGIFFFFRNRQYDNYKLIVFCFVCTGILLIIDRFLLTYITEFVFKRLITKRKVIIVGYNDVGKQLAEYFNNNKYFYSLAGFFDNQTDASANSLYRGRIEESMNFAVQHQVTDAYSTILPEEDERTWDLKNMAENKGIRLLFVANNSKQIITRETYHRVDFINKMPVLSLRAEPLLLEKNRIRKRVFDILFSTAVIILIMSWLTPLLAIIIKLSSPGPVFFIQQRSGKDNQPFWCFKFRSMTVNNSSDEKQATKDDNRITRIGAFMRKTSIDELPQFFNVFIGNMSIVGPRPHMLKHTEQYSAIIDKYLVRHYLKPGITGWAQVNGYRGETADVSLMEKRVAFDIEYMENWSLMQDVKIVFMTIINIVRGEENAR